MSVRRIHIPNFEFISPQNTDRRHQSPNNGSNNNQRHTSMYSFAAALSTKSIPSDKCRETPTIANVSRKRFSRGIINPCTKVAENRVSDIKIRVTASSTNTHTHTAHLPADTLHSHIIITTRRVSSAPKTAACAEQ